jgi:hypothetical protein
MLTPEQTGKVRLVVFDPKSNIAENVTVDVPETDYLEFSGAVLATANEINANRTVQISVNLRIKGKTLSSDKAIMIIMRIKAWHWNIIKRQRKTTLQRLLNLLNTGSKN